MATWKVLIGLCLLLGATPDAWALKPDRVYHQTPDSLGLAYTARVLKTPDGAAINTWTFVPAAAKNRHTTVVLAYADAGNMGSFLYHANALSQAGYQVVTFDYRGFGQSSDFAMNPSQLYYPEFAEDLRTVVRAARRQFPQQKLGVVSLSMGTIVAATVAAEGKLDFLVGDGFVTNPQEFIGRVKLAKNKDVLLPAAASQYPQLLAKVKCPMLVFSGTQDQVTTLADSQQLVARKDRHRELVQFEGGHMAGFAVLSRQPISFQTFGDLYVERISAFLSKAGLG
ncbi:alpha/beta fold hydrolase [Hymenobacter algoricola]|uniref:Alpha/beta fold hydrolase n=2 Tax=Hymenobacter algoricola TaxID=486267 RepID=A0ABP7MM86_9BACT